MSELIIEDLHVDIPIDGNVLHAVRGVSFKVHQGETLCIVGESGCGKSLTALSILGLLPKKARRAVKSLRFGELDLASLDERALSRIRGDRISMIFQDPMTSLNPSYTIGNQLEEVYLRHKREGRRAARQRAIEVLAKVKIPDPEQRLMQYPHQLSGGLRQRIMIAMGLMCEPELLIADEPTTALDVHIQVQILKLLRELQRELGLSIVLITHDLGIVARFAQKVAVMYAGKIVESGPVKSVFATPSHPYTRGLLECIPIPGKTPRKGELGAIPGVVPSLIGKISGCAFASRCSLAAPICNNEVRKHALSNAHMCECNFPMSSTLSLASEGSEVIDV